MAEACIHPGCAQPARAALPSGRYCDLHRRLYTGRYSSPDVLAYYRDVWRLCHGNGATINAILTTWRQGAEGWHTLHQVDRIVPGDAAPTPGGLPTQAEPTQIARWARLSPAHCGTFLHWPMPDPDDPDPVPLPWPVPAHFVLLYQRYGALHSIASAGVPTIDGVVDARVFSHSPRVWLPGDWKGPKAPSYARYQILSAPDVAFLPTAEPVRFITRAVYGKDVNRPGNGRPPYYAEGQELMLYHPTDGYAPLTAEQEEAAYYALTGLDDKDLRLFFACMDLHHKRSSGEYDRKVFVSANDLLSYLGFARHGGTFHREDKEAVAQVLRNLNQVYVRVEFLDRTAKQPKQRVARGRMLELGELAGGAGTDQDLLGFWVGAGAWIIPFLDGTAGSPQFAALPGRALQYNTHYAMQRAAFRASVYVTQQLRIRAKTGNFSQPFRIRTILRNISPALPADQQERRRLMGYVADAFERMLTDGVIAGWGYMSTSAPATFEGWLDETVRFDPPATAQEQYAQIEARHTQSSTPTTRKRG